MTGAFLKFDGATLPFLKIDISRAPMKAARGVCIFFNNIWGGGGGGAGVCINYMGGVGA